MNSTCCAVLELRQYTLHPGKRDVLIELFEREFLESQEALGMRVVGQFRDAIDPDRFVWLRGFRDMPARGEALAAFYGGPVWQAHRNTANPTMIDASNVLLLRPLKEGYGFAADSERAAVGTKVPPASRIAATVYLLRSPVDDALVRLFENEMKPALAAAGAMPIATFQTEYAANNFPRLPIREGEHALVWFARFANVAAHAAFQRRLTESGRWNRDVMPALSKLLLTAPQALLLEPAARSALR
ncbi:MAG: NIPSNAP family protein [Betaproteobacteria bacterium]|nr:NIPSNAP family protein [Betaproteobacteria bacterium]